MLDKKLQLKEGQCIAVIGDAPQLQLDAGQSSLPDADAVLVFVTKETGLADALPTLKSAAGQSKLAWVAYPKAKQLSTDLNRDKIRDIANQNGLDPVRQIAIDETWSALRLKTLQ